MLQQLSYNASHCDESHDMTTMCESQGFHVSEKSLVAIDRIPFKPLQPCGTCILTHPPCLQLHYS